MLSIALHPFTRQYTTAICSTFPSFRSMWFYYAQPSQPKKQASKKQTTNRHKINKQTNKQTSKQANKQTNKQTKRLTKNWGAKHSHPRRKWVRKKNRLGTNKSALQTLQKLQGYLPACLPTYLRTLHTYMWHNDIHWYTTSHDTAHKVTWHHLAKHITQNSKQKVCWIVFHTLYMYVYIYIYIRDIAHMHYLHGITLLKFHQTLQTLDTVQESNSFETECLLHCSCWFLSISMLLACTSLCYPSLWTQVFRLQ